MVKPQAPLVVPLEAPPNQVPLSAPHKLKAPLEVSLIFRPVDPYPPHGWVFPDRALLSNLTSPGPWFLISRYQCPPWSLHSSLEELTAVLRH